jgi:tetratricopeptide (TPR) repeat protein
MSFARIIAAGAAIGLFLAPTIASGDGGGGGGMGGGMTPGATQPQYDAAAEYRKGVEALKAEKFADAKRAFDHVLTVAPRDANANYLAGLARTGLGDYKGAARPLEKAVKIDPSLIGAQQQLGIAYAKTGDKAKAQAVLDGLTTRSTTCAQTCPQAADLAAAIAGINAALGAGPQARVDSTPGPLFASAASGDAAYLSAVALINEHRYEDAITALEQSRRAFGPHPDILTYLGFANRKLKRYDIAEGYYREALALAPHHRGATEYYGELMVERGDLAGARRMLASLDARCSFGCAEAEELRGWINTGHGKPS